MSLYQQFKSDPELEKSGVVLEYGFTKDKKPIGIRIARAGASNTKYTKRADILMKPYRRQIQTETIDREVVDGVLRKLFAETVVLGWENVQDESGNDLPFTSANCIKLFTDLPDLFADVQEQSQRAALFRSELQEADAGN